MNVGIIGGGQLGRMLALAGHSLGLQTVTLETTDECPAAGVTRLIVGGFEHRGDLERLAAASNVVTFEFENVPVDSIRHIAQRVPVHPSPAALEAAQDRVLEKALFRQLGIPTADFAPVDSTHDLNSAVDRIGLPAVLKTRRLGYDGKGQRLLRPADADALDAAWTALGAVPMILERHVPFQRELAIVAVRGRSGVCAFYPLVETRHDDGILSTAMAPAPNAPPALQEKAESLAARLMDRLNYVGVMALELFELEGQLFGNEFAPRVHNSGHWTLDGAETSQFENHLRAICGWPLGSTAPLGHIGMVNLIGSLPPMEKLLSNPHAHVHLYGKRARPGRKLGHVTVRADDPATRTARLESLREAASATRTGGAAPS